MTDSKSSLVLLLTATIDPGKTLLVARSDPKTRLRDYELALQAWLRSNAVANIVFCENSGYDLGSLEKLTGSAKECQVEFLSFKGNEGGANRGKGYSELVGMEHALRRSKLLSNCRMIVKCTGRLSVANANSLFERIHPLTFDIMCELKNCLSFADSRVFVATPDFISNYLLPQREKTNDLKGIFFEHALACASALAIADRKIWRPFPIYPEIRGISGTFGKVITEGRVKRLAKSIYYRFRKSVYEN